MTPAPAPFLWALFLSLMAGVVPSESLPEEEAFVRAPDPEGAEDLLAEVEVTPEILERGAALYAGGSCVFCHNRQGQGTSRGPALDDELWLHGDGSLAAIRRVIWTGVPRREQRGRSSPYDMRPQGGVSLDAAGLDALAAYVWSLSRRPDRPDR